MVPPDGHKIAGGRPYGRQAQKERRVMKTIQAVEWREGVPVVRRNAKYLVRDNVIVRKKDVGTAMCFVVPDEYPQRGCFFASDFLEKTGAQIA